MLRSYWNMVLTFVTLVSFALIGCARSQQTPDPGPGAAAGDGASRASPPLVTGVRTPSAIPSATRGETAPKVVLEMSGKVVFPKTERLYFETGGTVERLLVDEGDSIKKGDEIAALDASTIISLQKQVAVARVALDDAKKALKDEQERYISGDVQALQARVTQVQKELYVLQQNLENNKKVYHKKLEDKLGISIPVTILDQPPEQLADALIARVGVNGVWGAYQDYVRRLLEGPWEQINKLKGDIFQQQQILRSQEQSRDDLTKGITLTKAQADVQLANSKLDSARLEKTTAVLKRNTAVLQRDSAVASKDSALREYRDKVRDLLGFTVDRELGNNFYIHLTIGGDSPRTLLEQKLDEHTKSILGRSLQPEMLSDADPESIVTTIVSSQEGRDHVLDYFLLNKAAASWLALQKARQDVIKYNTARNQASVLFNRRTGDATQQESLWADLLVADRQLNDSIQSRDAARVAYKQLIKDYLNIDLDQSRLILWEEEQADTLLKRFMDTERNSFSIPARLRLSLTDALQTMWSKVQQANLDLKTGDLNVQKAEVTIQQSEIAVRDAEEAVRQARNTLEDVDSKFTIAKLEAQNQATLSRIRQLQDQLKDAEDQYRNVVNDYMDIELEGLQVNQSPDVILGTVKPADTPGFRRFKKDVVLVAQEFWGQIQKNLEDTGKNERTLKKAREDLADAQKGPDPLLITRREQEVIVASKNLEDLERKVNGSVLKAPFNGLIRRVTLERGDPVQAYQTLVEIIDLSDTEVEITVDELDMASLVPGSAVQITMDAFPGKVFTGRLNVMYPAPKAMGTALQYVGKVRLDNAPAVSFYEGMSARVRFEAPQTAPAPRR